jgi:hypothetical protein
LLTQGPLTLTQKRSVLQMMNKMMMPELWVLEMWLLAPMMLPGLSSRRCVTVVPPFLPGSPLPGL